MTTLIGAGVSKGSGLPDWAGLLNLVATSLAHEERIVGDLDISPLPLPLAASILEDRCDTRSDFVRHVRAALYGDFAYFGEGVTKQNRRAFVRDLQQKNLTMRTIASFCATREPGARTYQPNPRVHAVVTFNLDALLQAYVYARYEKRLLRTIERASAQAVSGRINTYHMHGFLRFDRKAENPAKESDLVVLTEQDYFDFFGSPTSLFNYTFLYLLREHTCVFVGLSLKDQNLRRLLHVSASERVKGLVEEGRTQDEARKEALRHFAFLPPSGSAASDELFAQSLHRLGTSVLWVDDFADLEPYFRNIYEGTGSDWDLVF